MRKLLILVVALVDVGVAQTTVIYGNRDIRGFFDAASGTFRLPQSTVAALPAAIGVPGRIYVVTDGPSCTSGGGSTAVLCRSNGTAWVTLGGSGGGGVWGSITGTLSDQTDLAAALGGKEPAIAAGTTAQYWRGDKSWQTMSTAVLAAMSGLYEVPLTFSSGLTRTTNAISCNTASGSVFGCLLSADWTTFNSKQSAISGAPGTWPSTFAPSAHANTHASDGGDPVTLSESQTAGLVADLAAKAPLASPTFSGTVTMPATLLGKYTVGTPGAGQTALPAASSYPSSLAEVVDCETTSACSTGGGSVAAWLRSNGSVWSLASGGGGSGTPVVTPVAVSSGDTTTTIPYGVTLPAASQAYPSCVRTSDGAGMIWASYTTTTTQMVITWSGSAGFTGFCTAIVGGAIGPANPGAATLQSGSGAPANGMGNNGDFYVRTDTSCFYGPKASGVWPGSCTSIIGPAGAAVVAPTALSTTCAGTVNWAVGSVGIAGATITTTGACNLTVSGMLAGGYYSVLVTQGSGGSHTLTLGTGGTGGCTAWKVGGGGSGAVAPTSTAGAIDALAFFYNGAICYANYRGNFN